MALHTGITLSVIILKFEIYERVTVVFTLVLLSMPLVKLMQPFMWWSKVCMLLNCSTYKIDTLTYVLIAMNDTENSEFIMIHETNSCLVVVYGKQSYKEKDLIKVHCRPPSQWCVEGHLNRG